MSPNNVAAIDRVTLDALREGQDDEDPDLVAELAVIFFADTIERLGLLRKAIDSADAAGVERQAHTLKGSSVSLGAIPMSLMCSELEEKARAGFIEGASESASMIEEEFERARRFLEIEIAAAAYAVV